MQVVNKLSEQQQQPVTTAAAAQQPPVVGLPPTHPVHVQQLPVMVLPVTHPVPGQQMTGSLSSSQTSNQPMNSIPPTHTTSSVPITTAYQGHGYIPTPAYQPVSAALTSAQLLSQTGMAVPAVRLTNGLGPDLSSTMATGQHIQGQPVVSMATPMGMAAPLPVSAPNFVGALPADGHTEQMRRVRDYQQYLLPRHEQSKLVLAETKAKIERGVDNLMQRHPKLDRTRLKVLAAKYVGKQPEIPQQDSMISATTAQGQVPLSAAKGQMSHSAMESQGQSQAVPISSLVASLASHPYYAQSFTQQQQLGPTRGLQEETSEGETSSPGSAASDKADLLTTRQEQLLRQLADIQRQKDEIRQLQSIGQDRVKEKQNQLRAKLATVTTEDAQAQSRGTGLAEEKKVKSYFHGVQLISSPEPKARS